jgi:hypothetical protein
MLLSGTMPIIILLTIATIFLSGTLALNWYIKSQVVSVVEMLPDLLPIHVEIKYGGISVNSLRGTVRINGAHVKVGQPVNSTFLARRIELRGCALPPRFANLPCQFSISGFKPRLQRDLFQQLQIYLGGLLTPSTEVDFSLGAAYADRNFTVLEPNISVAMNSLGRLKVSTQIAGVKPFVQAAENLANLPFEERQIAANALGPLMLSWKLKRADIDYEDKGLVKTLIHKHPLSVRGNKRQLAASFAESAKQLVSSFEKPLSLRIFAKNGVTWQSFFENPRTISLAIERDEPLSLMSLAPALFSGSF